MAVHSIMIPDWLRGDELRSVVWDDEAGTITGTHNRVADIQRIFDAPKPVTIGDPGGTWDLTDPAHNPREFLTMLGDLFRPSLREPLRSTLPAVFDGLEPLEADPGEILYNADGSALV